LCAVREQWHGRCEIRAARHDAGSERGANGIGCSFLTLASRPLGLERGVGLDVVTAADDSARPAWFS